MMDEPVDPDIESPEPEASVYSHHELFSSTNSDPDDDDEMNVSHHSERSGRSEGGQSISSEMSSTPLKGKPPQSLPVRKKPAERSNDMISMTTRYMNDVFNGLKKECRKENVVATYDMFKRSVMILFVSESSWTTGVFYLTAGLFLSFWCEMLKNAPKYNSTTLLVLMASVAFKRFPSNSVRPQILLTVLTVLSIALDIHTFSRPPQVVSSAAKGLTACVLVCKCLALYYFLWLSEGADRARKYLQRRVRVFLLPVARPRKVMREIRARILALEWIQFVSMVGYFVLFIVGVSTVGFSRVMTSPSRGIPLAAFFPLKALSSGLVFLGFLADTDMILCLSYFGCLGWAMRYVKVYIHRKRQEYGGWPLPYGLNPYRFYVLCAVKFADVCWGIGGWVTLGTTFGAEFYNQNDNVIALVSGSVFMLLLSDVWCPILFYVVYSMLNDSVNEIQRHNHTGEESDDSELDEFNIRNDEKSKRLAEQYSVSQRMHGWSPSAESDDSRSSGSSSGSSSSRRRGGRRKKREVGVAEIDLNMALGSPGGSSCTSEDSPVKTSRDQFESTRSVRFQDNAPATSTAAPISRHQFDSSRENPTLRSVSPSPVKAADFSPGKGDWAQASHNAAMYNAAGRKGLRRPQRTVKRIQVPLSPYSEDSQDSEAAYSTPPKSIQRHLKYSEGEDGDDEGDDDILPPLQKLPDRVEDGIVIDRNTNISPGQYTKMWDTLGSSASFSARLYPEYDAADLKIVQLVEHLQNENFYIVAAGQNEGVATLYGFASGYMRGGEEEMSIETVYFLLELKIFMDGSSEDGLWTMTCEGKCTHPSSSPTFIKMMLLGDVLQLAST